MILRADDVRRVAEFEKERALRHEAARLMAFAFHDPKNLPNYKPMNAPVKKTADTTVDDERVRGFFMGLALRAGG